jgi:hypothetical protein
LVLLIEPPSRTDLADQRGKGAFDRAYHRPHQPVKKSWTKRGNHELRPVAHDQDSDHPYLRQRQCRSIRTTASVTTVFIVAQQVRINTRAPAATTNSFASASNLSAAASPRPWF